MENLTQWQLTFAGIENLFLRSLLGFVVIAMLFLSWYGLRTITPVSKRLLLLALRFTGIFLLAALLLQPQIEQKEILRLKNKVVCLLDDSKSMELKGGNSGVSRNDLVEQFFQANDDFIEELHKEFEVDYFTFSDTMQETSYNSIEDGLVPDGRNTDFAEMLKLLKKRYEGKSIKAFLLFSDGADTVDLPSSINKVDLLSNLAQDLNAPFYTFSPNSNTEIKDIAISKITYNNFTFARSLWKAEVTIKILGYNNLKLPVTLKQGNDIISSMVLHTGEEKELYLDLSFTPYKTGTFLYTISIPVQSDEEITSNNQASFLVKVVRDKIRIMHVCGRPSWDERFLRRALKSDPNIDLISFFILRTPTDVSHARNDELSLIPFPVDELFTQVIDSFDLIIFQNFDYRPYDSSFMRFSHYLHNIENFVREQGGGFIMLGGNISFADGGYTGTAIENILPLYLSGEKETIDTSRLKAQLTPDGQKHPVTSLADTSDRNISIWQNLPELDGCNLTGPLRSDAVALIVYPTKNKQPLCAVRDVGSGRTMAITTDSLWKWNFLSVGKGGSNRHYMQFWQNAIKWLIKDPVFNPVRITTEKENVSPGEDIKITVEALGKNYNPLEGVMLEVNVTNEFSGKSVFLASETTGSDGLCEFSFNHDQEGFYIITATAKKEEQEIGQDEAIFHIETENKEFEDPSIRKDILTKISAISGGSYFELPVRHIQDKLTIENPPIIKLAGKRHVSLWDNIYIFMIILSIFSLEWWIRKRSGLS